MLVERRNRTLVLSAYGNHPEDIVRHAAQVEPTIEIEVRYAGSSNVFKAIVLDNIVLPAIVEALRNAPPSGIPDAMGHAESPAHDDEDREHRDPGPGVPPESTGATPFDPDSTWTLFWDMHSGGSMKLDANQIYIEADEDEAARLFESHFGRDPHNVTCDCCGPDYSMSSGTLREVTAYHRGCEFEGGDWAERPDEGGGYMTLDRYIAWSQTDEARNARKSALFLRRSDILGARS